MATAAEIQQIYQDVLGRSAQSGGLNYWLGTGDSIEKIRDDIAKGDEAKGKVQDLYTELLGPTRVADFAGNDQNASWWVGEEGLGANEAGKGTLAAVRSNIMLSDEYKNKQSTVVDEVVEDEVVEEEETVDVEQVKEDTITELETILADVGANTTVDNTIANIDALTGGVSLNADGTGTLDQVNNEAVKALSATLDGATESIKSLDLTDTLDDIGKADGDLSELKTWWTGLGGDFDTLQDSQYADVLKNLDSTYGTQLTDLNTQLSDLGVTTESKLKGLRSDLTTDLQTKYDNITNQFDTRVSNLDKSWRDQLSTQNTQLGARIDTASQTFDKKLADISANMDYRMLGDSAAGVKMRRSKAFSTGKTRKGTGQLSRAMKINSLNI